MANNSVAEVIFNYFMIAYTGLATLEVLVVFK